MVKLYFRITLFSMIDEPKWPLSKVTVHFAQNDYSYKNGRFKYGEFREILIFKPKLSFLREKSEKW